MLIRTSKHILKYSNNNKLEELEKLFVIYKDALEFCITLILQEKLPLKKFCNTIPDLLEIKHSRWKQLVYKQASEIVRSTIKKNSEIRFRRYKKVYAYFKEKERMCSFTAKKFSELNLKQKFYIKPDIENISITLDNRFFDIEKTDSYFNEFIHLRFPHFYENKRRAVSINFPIKYHKQSLKFRDWERSNTIQLKKINNNFYISFYYKHTDFAASQHTDVLGVDIGYKKLFVTSKYEIIGKELEQLYNKISRAKRNSTNYKQLLVQRTNLVNKCVNTLFSTNSISKLIVEDLKNVKKDTKKNSKLSSKFANKLQYWTYNRVLFSLENKCKEQGIELVKVSPAYTSQTCSKCKHIDKNSRKGEKFVCTACSYEIDADINAAINIRNRGVYSPSNMKT